MAKTIHIHLHRAPARARTVDAGEFDESKHKRDDSGKFSSSGGGGGKKPEGTKPPGQNLAHGDPKKEATAAHARIMEKQAARAANDPTKHFAPGSGPEAKAAAARLAAKHAARRSEEQPVAVKETETHPWVHKFVRTHSNMAAMKAAIAKNETPAIQQVLAGLEKHPHQGATQKMVKDLLREELVKRGATK